MPRHCRNGARPGRGGRAHSWKDAMRFTDFRRQLLDYRQRHPEEAATVDAFAALLDDPQDPFVRARLEGHFTGSAWVVSADGERALLTHHRKLDRWLQPGGHADGDIDLAQVALREAQEETGVPGLRLEDGALFDLDRHWIPERRDVPGHWHYDARYVVRAGADERYVVSGESHDLAWREVAAIHATADDDSMRRLAAKWLARRNAAP